MIDFDTLTTPEAIEATCCSIRKAFALQKHFDTCRICRIKYLESPYRHIVGDRKVLYGACPDYLLLECSNDF